MVLVTESKNGAGLVVQSDVHPTGDQEVAGSTPARSGDILSYRFIMKYFPRSLSPFRWFKKGSCQFLLDMTLMGWLGRKT